MPDAAAPILLSPDQAAESLAIGRSQLWRLHSAGRLPAPTQLGQRCPRWNADELRAWAAAGCPTRQQWERLKLDAKT